MTLSTDFFTRSFTGLRGHELKLLKPQVCLDARKYFFFTIRVIDAWNSLPATLINCGTLKPTHHITEACKKPNRMLRVIKCTIVYKNPYILVTLYKSLVCLHLEYCCSAWSPHYHKDKELLEKIQRHFTRMFKELKELDYYDRLQSLDARRAKESRRPY